MCCVDEVQYVYLWQVVSAETTIHVPVRCVHVPGNEGEPYASQWSHAKAPEHLHMAVPTTQQYNVLQPHEGEHGCGPSQHECASDQEITIMVVDSGNELDRLILPVRH